MTYGSDIVDDCIFVLQVQTDQFSHLLKGLQYGCPPHGGVALGMGLSYMYYVYTDHESMIFDTRSCLVSIVG